MKYRPNITQSDTNTGTASLDNLRTQRMQQ